MRRTTESTKSRKVNTGKNNTATHQLAIHQLVLSTMPSENDFTIFRSKLVACWHFLSWCLTTLMLEPGRALQGISMCDTGHVLESTACTVHFCIHKTTCFWILVVVTSLEHSTYSCGHCLSFLLRHILILINTLNRKRFHLLLRNSSDAPVRFLLFPSRMTRFSYCVLTSTLTLNWKHMFDNSIFWAESQKRWGKGNPFSVSKLNQLLLPSLP